MPGEPARAVAWAEGADMADGPLVSCIMPTRGALQPAVHAIGCFRRQSYPNRELVVTCADSGSAVEDYVAALGDPAIRWVASAGERTCGALRNVAIAAARGRLICLWDDDDLSHPERIAWQAGVRAATEAAGCFLSRELLWWPARERIARSPWRAWENSLLAERGAVPLYPDQRRGGDTAHGMAMRDAVPLVLLDRPQAYCYIVHGTNLWDGAHFEMLFAQGDRRQDGAACAAAIAAIGTMLPIADYAAGIAATSAG